MQINAIVLNISFSIVFVWLCGRTIWIIDWRKFPFRPRDTSKFVWHPSGSHAFNTPPLRKELLFSQFEYTCSCFLFLIFHIHTFLLLKIVFPKVFVFWAFAPVAVEASVLGFRLLSAIDTWDSLIWAPGCVVLASAFAFALASVGAALM